MGSVIVQKLLDWRRHMCHKRALLRCSFLVALFAFTLATGLAIAQGVQPRAPLNSSRTMQGLPFALRETAHGVARTALVPGASPTFSAASDFGSGGLNAYSVAVADVNKDGKPDLLVANGCVDSNCANGTVGVLLGNGDGTFQAAVAYGSGGYAAVSVAVADVNGDGKLDLVVANLCASSSECLANGGVVSVLLGNGDGTFQAAVAYRSGGYEAESVAVADVNGDGKPDLLVANYCQMSSNCTPQNKGFGVVGVLLGNGDGTFRAATVTGSGGIGAFSLAVGDINGDGKPDLVVANRCADSECLTDSTVGVLLGNGDGTFQAAFPASYDSGGFLADALALADVNGDGKPDVVVANQCVSSSSCSNSRISVLLGRGDGTFNSAVTTTTAVFGFGALALADFDGDGYLDLASGPGNFLLRGNGDGNFQTPIVLGVSGGLGIAVGDFNGDGKPDLAIGGTAAGGVTVLLNIGTATTTSLSSSINPSSFNQSVMFTVAVTPKRIGTPTGTVAFTDGAASLATVTLANGIAMLTTSALTAGAHSITASYSGDSNFNSSVSSALPQTVNPAGSTTTASSSLNPSTFGQSVALNASVTPKFGGVATGSVTFKDGTNVLGTVVVGSNAASLVLNTLQTGSHSITAVYSGDSNVGGSTSVALSQSVSIATTSTSLISSSNPGVLNQAITFTAAVTGQYGGAPTGSVTFKSGNVILDSRTIMNGQAVLIISFKTAGKRIITAEYVGDINDQPSTSAPLSQVINYNSTATGLTSSSNPSFVGQSVTLTAKVSSSAPSGPTGTVTFKNGTTNLGTGKLDSTATATLVTTKLPLGSASLTASYSGDTQNAKSTSSVLMQTTDQAQLTLSLASSPNPSTSGKPVKFTATLTSNGGLPEGQIVSFTYNNTTLGTAKISGKTAIFSTTALPSGSDQVTATFAGTADYSSASNTVTQMVN